MEDWDALEDTIAEVLNDSLDMDWTGSVGARAVVQLLQEKSVEQSKSMVDRFLQWKLPEHFNPDGGVNFEPLGDKGAAPLGTNLLTYTQAEEMVGFMLEQTQNRKTQWKTAP